MPNELHKIHTGLFAEDLALVCVHCASSLGGEEISKQGPDDGKAQLRPRINALEDQGCFFVNVHLYS